MSEIKVLGTHALHAYQPPLRAVKAKFIPIGRCDKDTTIHLDTQMPSRLLTPSTLRIKRHTAR